MAITREEYLRSLVITVKSAKSRSEVATILNEAEQNLKNNQWTDAQIQELWRDVVVYIKEQYHGTTDANYLEAQAILDRRLGGGK